MSNTQRWIVGICIFIFVTIIGLMIYYEYIYRVNYSVIMNIDELLQKADALLTEEGNVAYARTYARGTAVVLRSLNTWYAWPGHRVRAKRLLSKIDLLDGKIAEREALHTQVTAVVETCLVTSDFENAYHTINLAMTQTGGRDIVLRALWESVQHKHITYFLRQAIQHLKESHYAAAQQCIAAAMKASLSNDVRLSLVSNFIQRVIVQDFDGADQIVQKIRLTAEDQDLRENIAQIVQLGKQANFAKQSLIAEKVQHLIMNTRTPIHGFPKVQGKVMIWDYTKKGVEQAYALLRDDLRASPLDAEITIFGIRKRWDETIGHYTISHQPALQEYMEIGVVYWPSMECPGYATVQGGSPPYVRKVSHLPEWGSSVDIKNWIEGNARP